MAKALDEKMLVDGQIRPEDIAALEEQGVTLIVCNRPDEEEAGQPSAHEIEAACKAHGIAFHHVPVSRGIGPGEVEAMVEALEARGEGKALAYCRTGNRSTLLWAVARNHQGEGKADLCMKAEQAGYSLAPIFHLLDD